MENNKFLTNCGHFIIPAPLIIIILVLIPLPALLLDILALILIIAFLTIHITLYYRKIKDFSFFPLWLLSFSILSLFIQISYTRLILTQGADFNGWIIRAISFLVASSNEIAGLVVDLLIFIVFTFVISVAVIRRTRRVLKVSLQFTMDSIPGRHKAIEMEYSSGQITGKEANLQKSNLQKELNFYCSLDGYVKVISDIFKVSIFITAASMIGGFIIGFPINETVENVKGYVSLSIANGFLAQFLILIGCTSVLYRYL